MATAYDSVRYSGSVYTQTDPAALGALAKIFGLPFAPVARCRMLEIGCGDGRNLINLALAWPQARFVGVDLAETAIASAREEAEGCGLTNIAFHAADLRDIGESYSAFDYAVAHGVLSWAPRPVGDDLMRVIGERLAPGGLAMASFVALPGARSLQAIRDILLRETRGAATPEEKMARAAATLETLLAHWSAKDADQAHLIGAARRILGNAPWVMFHDEMGEAYEPRMLGEVAEAAARGGLLYLCDARPETTAEALFPTEYGLVARERAGGDWTAVQQWLDYRDMRSFHNALFVKGGAPDRQRCDERLAGLWMRCDLAERERDPQKPDEDVFVTGEGVRLTTNDPTLAALLRRCASVFPEALALGEDTPAEHVFRLLTSGIARFTTAPSPARRDAGARPRASALALREAAHGRRDLSTLIHTVARLDSDTLLALVRLLDGSHERAELAALWAAAAGAQPAQAAAALEGALGVLARAGLLTDGG